MEKIWNDAVAYIESKESRVRSEIQQVAGEDCHVWRWLPNNSRSKMWQGDAFETQEGNVNSLGVNRRKIWQGQAFETQEGSVNSLSVSPTPCLKIRHMFDPDV